MVIHFKIHPPIPHILSLCWTSPSLFYVIALWQRVFSWLMELIILARMSHSNYHHFLGIYQLMNSVIRLHFCFIIFHPHQAMSLKWLSLESLEKNSLPKSRKFKIHDTRSNTFFALHRFSLVWCSWPFHNFISLSHQNNQWADCALIQQFFIVYRSTTENEQINFRKDFFFCSTVKDDDRKTFISKTAAKSLIPFSSPDVKLLDNFTWSTFCMEKFFLRFNLVERQHGTETFPSAFSCFMTQFSWLHFPLSFPHSMERLSIWKVGSILKHALIHQNKPRLIRKYFVFLCNRSPHSITESQMFTFNLSQSQSN